MSSHDPGTSTASAASSTTTIGNVKIRGRGENQRLDVFTSDGWKTIQHLAGTPSSLKSLKAIRQPMVELIYSEFENSTITTNDGYEISLSKKGLNHIGFGPGTYPLFYRYLLVKSISQIEGIINRAALLNEEPHKSGDPSCRIYIFLSTYISDDGYPVNVKITVKEDIHTHKKHYDHYFVME